MTQITIAANDAVDQYAVGSTPTTGPFTISYPYFNENDIKVYVDGVLKTITTHYTISGTAVDDGFSGGTVTFVSNISNVTLTLNRDVPIARESDFPTSGIFNIGTLNTTLDKAYAILQQINTIISRAISRPSTSPETYSLVWPDGFDTTERTVKVTTSGGIEVGPSIADVSNAQTYATNAANSASAAAADLVITNADVVSASVSETNAASSAASAAASAAGIYWKAPVVVATTANITLSGEQTIDSILTSASRVLVKSQTAPAENGIYVTAAGAWSRAIPMDTWDEHVGAVVLVNQGGINGNQAFQCTVTPGGTLGTTDVTFAAFGAVAVNFAVDNFAAGVDYTAGSSTTITLSGDPGSEENCRITFDGVMQHHNTWTLGSGDGVVTFDAAIPSSIANIEAQYGSTIGVGTPSDGTVSTVKIVDNAVTLAKLAAGTDGELITWDASGNPATVAVGTSTHVLTSNGAGAAPTFQAAAGGAWNLISSATASASSSIDFASGIDSTYDVYKLYIVALTPSNTSTSLFMRVKQSGISRSNGGDYRWRVSSAYYQNGYGAAEQNNSDTEIELATGPGSEGASGATGKFIHSEITMYKPSDTTGVKNFNFVGYTANQSLRHMGLLGQGIFQGNTAAIDGLDFRMSAGTITVGGFYLYGLSKS